MSSCVGYCPPESTGRGYSFRAGGWWLRWRGNGHRAVGPGRSVSKDRSLSITLLAAKRLEPIGAFRSRAHIGGSSPTNLRNAQWRPVARLGGTHGGDSTSFLNARGSTAGRAMDDRAPALSSASKIAATERSGHRDALARKLTECNPNGPPWRQRRCRDAGGLRTSNFSPATKKLRTIEAPGHKPRDRRVRDVAPRTLKVKAMNRRRRSRPRRHLNCEPSRSADAVGPMAGEFFRVANQLGIRGRWSRHTASNRFAAPRPLGALGGERLVALLTQSRCETRCSDPACLVAVL